MVAKISRGGNVKVRQIAISTGDLTSHITDIGNDGNWSPFQASRSGVKHPSLEKTLRE